MPVDWKQKHIHCLRHLIGIAQKTTGGEVWRALLAELLEKAESVSDMTTAEAFTKVMNAGVIEQPAMRLEVAQLQVNGRVCPSWTSVKVMDRRWEGEFTIESDCKLTLGATCDIVILFEGGPRVLTEGYCRVWDSSVSPVQFQFITVPMPWR